MPECSCRGANPNCFKCGGWGRIDDDVGKHRGGLSTLPVAGAKGNWKAQKKQQSSAGAHFSLGITYIDSRTSSSLKKRGNKKSTQTREEQRSINKAEFKQRRQANLNKNIQRHRKATDALSRISVQAYPWSQETEKKLRDIRTWIQKIEQWIKEDEKKLKIKKGYIPEQNEKRQKKKINVGVQQRHRADRE